MIRIVILLLIFTQTQINAQMDTTSYSIGVVIAKNLKSQGFKDLNLESFNDALNDVFKTGNMKINLEDANKNVQNFLSNAQASLHAENKDAGEAFLAENKNKPGVKTTTTGLQYLVLEEGMGTEHPTLLNEVNVHYHGTTIDGKVFDSSVDRGEPISFPLGNVIKGWQEGVQLMTVGSKFRFFIPYDLAYGERGAGQDIKPYSALVFEVTLLDIK
ncbi:MAG: FKBP-type peptidyl-prolyl cis-trans isomerase [Saprospiraceae bacterium]|nr:FKBP-type peptidyl-prolyl cis-trans isomerase [Bacteroidia bacterium]NNE16401.1 FKBP-type peptidyl-prolyl cis-trans isomerase [Saprospiraceae bacterium]NNL93495.1 FKBP-type peptidyl-prolyl cis-trans isomerase [Saprospiraceae bacterium]